LLINNNAASGSADGADHGDVVEIQKAAEPIISVTTRAATAQFCFRGCRGSSGRGVQTDNLTHRASERFISSLICRQRALYRPWEGIQIIQTLRMLSFASELQRPEHGSGLELNEASDFSYRYWARTYLFSQTGQLR